MSRPLQFLASAALAVSLAAGLVACNKAPEATPAPAALVPSGALDRERLLAVAAEPGAWLTSGRDFGKTHYSPLDLINQANVDRLGFAWQYETGTTRGMEATPVVIDGVMYTTGVAGRAYALDAATGKLLWQFEPEVNFRNARSACCDIVNRGLAVWRGKVYVGAFDGVLYALNAADGKVLWQTQTFDGSGRPYSITGAPQVAGKVVVIGNGGAEYDSRGYISAYDLESGKLVWRFYTVPGDPSKPFESKALEMAAKTWKGDGWKYGGGGNPWDAINYDPDLNLVYFGTANGAPWNYTARSEGKGDNLFLASIVAVNADTGEYAWHYQTTPGERWDFDATPHIMLATLKLGGQDRQVLMQASKNGFFYVIDRKSGELLSADAFVQVNWATGVDMKTGRPIENPAVASYTETKPTIVFPSAVGAHNFNPMSLSAKTGLVYLPTVHGGTILAESPKSTPYLPGRMNSRVQVGFSMQLAAPQSLPPLLRPLADPKFLKTQPPVAMSAALKAWDPVSRKVVWSVPTTSFMDHGGVLSTAGGLVVQGGLDGRLRVYGDADGRLLKEIEVGTAMIAAPASYSVNGVQYIAILAGSGGGGWNNWMPGNVAAIKGNANRILAFRLDGGATPVPADLPPLAPLPEPPVQVGAAADIAAGGVLFGANCASCHGNAPRAPVPDLRRSAVIRDAASFQSVVRGGALQPRGMPAWDDLLSEAQVEQIRAHLVAVARSAYEEQQKGAPAAAPAAPALKEGHL
jgi:quinohemoprotein ethanol dehydrogenase